MKARAGAHQTQQCIVQMFKDVQKVRACEVRGYGSPPRPTSSEWPLKDTLKVGLDAGLGGFPKQFFYGFNTGYGERRYSLRRVTTIEAEKGLIAQ